MRAFDMNTFDVGLPLPPGATLVEASAGTGKTWSIARLVARLLAEDPPEGGLPPTIDRILVVTFTDAAAAELRDRVRALIAEAADTLDAVRNAGAAAGEPKDPALSLLAGAKVAGVWSPASEAVLVTRVERLRRAVGDFDRAAISTIHSFCQRVLRTLAFESDAPFEAELLKDTSRLLTEIVDDWYDAHVVPMEPDLYAWFTGTAKLSRKRLLRIAESRTANRGARFLPHAEHGWPAALEVRREEAVALRERCVGPEGAELRAAIEAAAGAGKLNKRSHGDLAEPWRELLAWLESGGLGKREKAYFGETFTNGARNPTAKEAGWEFRHPLAADLDAFGVHLPGEPLIDGFATAVDAAWRKRLAERHLVTFDDLLLRVADALARPEMLVALRSAYRVALIDEFQDTDATQWRIFRSVFLEDPTARLVLIGDPKQAIYSFRGADIGVYAAACDAVPAERRFTMRRNFRSDAPLIAALNVILGKPDDVFLTDAIGFESVSASHPARLYGAGEPVAPVVLRWFDAIRLGLRDPDASATQTPTRWIGNGDAMEALADVVARDIREERDSGWTVRVKVSAEGEPERFVERKVTAGDFAVLTATNGEAKAFRDALLAVGVPAVVAKTGSVFDSDECVWMERWLRALAAEGKDGPARAVAVTPLFGFTALQLLEARQSEDAEASADWLRFKEGLARQARLLAEDGFVAAFAHLLHQDTPPDDRSALERLSSLSTGERHLTNVRHLAELLDAVAQSQRLGAVGLARWLADRRARAEESEGAQFRLDADGDTVKVVTMHASKGLEYPIVYLPGLADGRIFRGKEVSQQPVRFYSADGALNIDLRGFGGGHAAAARGEQMKERQRLLYVALTRAAHRVVLYSGPTSGMPPGAGLPKQNYAQSPMGVLLHGATPDDDRRIGETDPEDLFAAARTFAPAHLPVEEVVPAGGADGAALEGGLEPTVAPEPFGRDRLESLWRRESYSGIVGKRKGKLGAIARGDEADVADRDADDDEEDDDSALEPAHGAAGAGDAEPMAIENPDDDVPGGVDDVPFRKFYSGAEAGKWVHAVFEHASFRTAGPKAGGELAELVRARGERAGFPKKDKDELLVQAFPRMLDTPLGAAFGGRRLRDVEDGDRLDELKFDIAVGTGEDERLDGRALLKALGAARDDDPMPEGYLAHVRSMNTRPLSGLLTGAIDLVVRAPVDGATRWFVVDYKTNTLGPRVDGRLARSAPGHYAQHWMRVEVARKHYYLQYVLYLVALHRYLSLRLGSDYDYDRDVGGALYLFVRGMLGAETASVDGRVHGVFHDKPPKAIIARISALLSRGGE